jgi:hypothetical protein
VSRIDVHTDELRAMARAFRQVKGAIAEERTLLRSYAETLGSAVVAEALDDAAGNWLRKRTEFLAHLDGMAAAADFAASAYDQADRAIASAASGGGS